MNYWRLRETSMRMRNSWVHSKALTHSVHILGFPFRNQTRFSQLGSKKDFYTASTVGRERKLSRSLSPKTVLVSRGKQFSRVRFWNLILARGRGFHPISALPNLREKRKKKPKHSHQGAGLQGNILETLAREGNRNPPRRVGQKHM